MKIHEYQSREIFSSAGIPVPQGRVATTAIEARAIATEIGGTVVIKAQVHVGGRGKAGGVKLARTPAEAEQHATKILGMSIRGLTVRRILVAEAVQIASEAYVGVVVDRALRRPVLIVSAAGGVEIEDVAKRSPEKIVKLPLDPLLSFQPFQARRIAYAIYDTPEVIHQTSDLIARLVNLFWEQDCTLVEINPLVVTPDDRVIAVDAKINFDDNALWRHPDWETLRDPDSELDSEVDARANDLSFVKLEGTIGCVVNGAGLAMATMDLVKRYGAEPANFLDIGGSSNPRKVIAAMRIILKDHSVRAILFNIFGGITRCDDVARGILQAIKELKPTVPIVVRLTGTNEREARRILEDIHLPVAASMDAVVRQAIELAVKAA
ncbi:MAG: ADP-forming succinate--CoA ligase subunit beta [candidate division Zixibacteria bacterium]|nr:ADP-forming succinate--CoA ligase subunit beta [candidate division Zixibacteria bacterium]